MVSQFLDSKTPTVGSNGVINVHHVVNNQHIDKLKINLLETDGITTISGKFFEGGLWFSIATLVNMSNFWW